TAKLRRCEALKDDGHSVEVLAEEVFLQRLGLHAHAEAVCRSYSLVELVRILGISRPQLRGLMKAGMVQPVESRGGLLYFDFRQASRVRAVLRLLSLGVSVRSVRRSLAALRRSLPSAAEPLDWLARLEVQEKRVLLR